MEIDPTQSPYALLKTLPLKKVYVMGYELYCAGHLFEAAVAHHRATDKTRLRDVARRFAEHIDATFEPGNRDAAPGHPEIGLALVKLFRESSQPRYLALAAFFIDLHGL